MSRKFQHKYINFLEIIYRFETQMTLLYILFLFSIHIIFYYLVHLILNIYINVFKKKEIKNIR